MYCDHRILDNEEAAVGRIYKFLNSAVGQKYTTVYFALLQNL